MNSNTENSATVTTDADEARTRRDNAETNEATNAEAAASEAATEAGAEPEGEAADAEPTQAKLSSVNLDDIVKLGATVKGIENAVAEHLEAIRNDQAQVKAAAEGMTEAQKVRTDLWSHTLAIVGIVAEATADTPSIRDLTYSAIMGEFLKAEKATTAKAYASTGRNVLVRMLTQEKVPFEKVQEMSYADVRNAMKKPPTREQAENAERYKKVREQLSFIMRHADKHGTEQEQRTATRLARIAETIEKEYNAVKSAFDRSKKQNQAAVELADLKQQSPREGATVETVAAGEGEVKPEVARRAQDERQRQVFKSQHRHN